ncbi:lipoprotein [Spiroplasma sp. DGKH1]|uniref:lipoprotein n=1 Tax=Spiroplasma sp. DGKH1 TaxID=3050074 RepID=UPI0034C67FA2
MKKLLSILGTTSLIATSTVSLVACHSKLTTNSQYFDSEVNNIDPVIRNQVKYTSSIAKMLIAARHENMNTYGFPTIQYFLNNMANNLQGTFKTKNGQEVKVGDYINGYKQLNNILINPRLILENQAECQLQNNPYNIMNNLVEMFDFNKWNKLPSTKADFVMNPKLGWAEYDTGAFANTLSQTARGVVEYVKNTESWWDYYNDAQFPGVSNIILDSSISSPPTPSELSYTSTLTDSRVTYGHAIAGQTSALYDLFGTQYFNLALSQLTNFGPGFELSAIYALTQIFPVAKTSYSGENALGFLLVAPLAVMQLQIAGEWFDKTNKVKDDSPLLQIFSRDTIDNLHIKFQEDNSSLQDLNLYSIIKKPNVLGYFLPGSSVAKEQYLDLTNPDHKNDFLKWYAILNAWLKAAIEKDNVVDFNKFNTIMSLAIKQGLENFQKSPYFKVAQLSSESAALIRTVGEMLISPGFDLFNFLRGIGGIANWFYTLEADTNRFHLNLDHVEHITKVYNDGPKMADFSTNLKNLDPKKNKYAQFVLEEFGLLPNQTTYQEGSLFDMINTWAHGKNNANPEQEAMHNFILNVLDLKNGYLGKLFENINQAMARDWFDNIFLDEKWNILASGRGVDGSQLGKVMKDGQLVGVRYQLDYYGPKDSSTDLNHHTKPIGYTNTVTGAQWGKEPSGEANVPNLAPDGENWSPEDWAAYDGNGNAYLPHSEQVKYSYVVEFDNEAQLLVNFKDIWTQNQNAFKMIDFNWFYDNKQYY